MKTETINPGATSVYTWDQKWYSDGMGMVPGTWTCANAGSRKPELTFSTDWGENVKILWGKRHADVARR